MFAEPRLWLLSLLVTAAILFSGATARAHGSLDTRIASLGQRIAEHPDDKHSYAVRAELHSEHGDLEAAEADLTQARRIDPAWSEVDLSLARCLLRHGKLKRAQLAIAAFRAREPDRDDGLRVEADIAYGLKSWGVAERLYTQYLSVSDRTEPDHYLRASESIALQGKQHLPRALNLLDQGIAKLGDAPVLREQAIRLAMQAGHHQGALQRVSDALSVAHHAERWLLLRGDILLALGEGESARAAYQASLAAIASRSNARQESEALIALRAEVEGKLTKLRVRSRRSD